MKKLVVPKTEKELSRTHPIASNIDGWFLKIIETSMGVFLVEATDCYGRIVSKRGNDADYFIAEIEKEISELISVKPKLIV